MFGKATMSALSDYIRSVMDAKGMTQRDLETKSGVPDSTLVRYVTGTIKRPNAATLSRIARGLGVSFGRLMDLAGLTIDAEPGEAIGEVPPDVVAYLAGNAEGVEIVRRIAALHPEHRAAVIAWLRTLANGGFPPPHPPRPPDRPTG